MKKYSRLLFLFLFFFQIQADDFKQSPEVKPFFNRHIARVHHRRFFRASPIGKLRKKRRQLLRAPGLGMSNPGVGCVGFGR